MRAVLRGRGVAGVGVRPETLRPLAHLPQFPALGEKSGAGAPEPDVGVHRQLLGRLDRAGDAGRHRRRRQVFGKDIRRGACRKYKYLK